MKSLSAECGWPGSRGFRRPMTWTGHGAFQFSHRRKFTCGFERGRRSSNRRLRRIDILEYVLVVAGVNSPHGSKYLIESCDAPIN